MESIISILYLFLLFSFIISSEVDFPLDRLDSRVRGEEMSALLMVPLSIFVQELTLVRELSICNWSCCKHLALYSLSCFSESRSKTWENTFVYNYRHDLFFLRVIKGFLSFEPALRLIVSQVELKLKLDLIW
jgi:hypothetical protein